jgi:hypothetical protein
VGCAAVIEPYRFSNERLLLLRSETWPGGLGDRHLLDVDIAPDNRGQALQLDNGFGLNATINA